jgi:hypothetical protein
VTPAGGTTVQIPGWDDRRSGRRDREHSDLGASAYKFRVGLGPDLGRGGTAVQIPCRTGTRPGRTTVQIPGWDDRRSGRIDWEHIDLGTSAYKFRVGLGPDLGCGTAVQIPGRTGTRPGRTTAQIPGCDDRRSGRRDLEHSDLGASAYKYWAGLRPNRGRGGTVVQIPGRTGTRPRRTTVQTPGWDDRRRGQKRRRKQ